MENAKGLSDKLIVGVSTDELVYECKQKYPVIPFNQRIRIIRNIKCVDVAIPQFDRDKVGVWDKIRYDILFVGDDWFNDPEWEENQLKLSNVGVDVIYFPYTKNISSTKINRILEENRE